MVFQKKKPRLPIKQFVYVLPHLLLLIYGTWMSTFGLSTGCYQRPNHPRLKMATGILPADTSVTNPHPRAKNHTRTRARYPPRVASYARARYPRSCLARGYARVPARPPHLQEDGCQGGASAAGVRVA